MFICYTCVTTSQLWLEGVPEPVLVWLCRANASTEDMERLGFARAKSAQKPKNVSQ